MDKKIKDKKTILEDEWYEKDSQQRKGKIFKAIDAGENKSTVIQEMCAFAEHLSDERRWLQSMVEIYLRPEIEAGRTEKEIWENWERIILSPN